MKRATVEVVCRDCVPARVTNTITCPSFNAASDWIFRFDDGQHVLEVADACPTHGLENLSANFKNTR